MKRFLSIIVLSFLFGGSFAQSSIPTPEITYWIGEGENEAKVVMYWCQDIPAGLALGYRWNGTSTVADMLTLLAADPRIDISGMENGWLDEYSFVDDNYNMHIAVQGYLVYSINDNWDMMLNMTDELSDGDVFQMKEWGNCDTPENIYPVSDINAPSEPFDGMVGAPDCQAIYFEDTHILGWATGVVLQRGWQDIANPVTLTSFGEESNALGASSLSTYDCVSLGDGGVATLTFDIPVTDGDGYDFAVFENSLDGYFLELAFVEVSSDGEHFVRFPASSNTPSSKPIGTFDTVYASDINNLAGKHTIGWGTPFDLQELAGSDGLDVGNISHVRIVDVVGTSNPVYASRDRYGRLVYDPYPTNFNTGGFDLSGVAVLNGWRPTGLAKPERSAVAVYPNPCTDFVVVALDANCTVELYNINGQLLLSEQSHGQPVVIDMKECSAGVYFLKVGSVVQKIMKR